MIAARRILLLQTPLLCFAIFTGRTINDLLGQEIPRAYTRLNCFLTEAYRIPAGARTKLSNPLMGAGIESHSRSLNPLALPFNHPHVVIGAADRIAPRTLGAVFM